MPISDDPNAIAKVWLSGDAKKPEAERPKFIFHFLSRRQRKQIRALWEKIHTLKLAEEQMVEVENILRIGLVGWENVKDAAGKPIDFSWDALLDKLTEDEMEELAHSYPSATDITEQDRKNSSSPSTSVGGGSAETASTAKPPLPKDSPLSTGSKSSTAAP